MTPEQTAERAREARAILEHPLLAEAVGAAREAIFAAWLKTDPLDAPKREQLHAEARAEARIIAHLKGIVDYHAVTQASRQATRPSGHI